MRGILGKKNRHIYSDIWFINGYKLFCSGYSNSRKMNLNLISSKYNTYLSQKKNASLKLTQARYPTKILKLKLNNSNDS